MVPTASNFNCIDCIIQPDAPNLVLSNGIDNITGQDLNLSRSGFSTAGVEFTAYTSYSIFPNGSDCGTSSTKISLATPFFVPIPTTDELEFNYYAAETPFVYDLRPDCTISDFNAPDGSSLFSHVSTLTLSRTDLPDTHLSSSSLLSAIASPPTTTATPSSLSASPSPSPQSSPVGSTDTTKLVIGLVVGIVALVILITVILSSLWVLRRRRGRKVEATTSAQDGGKDEPGDTQMYFQQKVELDDEQRRHEMEALEIRYEMEGEDRIHEMQGEESQRQSARQELRAEEHARELDDSQL